jgi:hypothetical protein
VRVAAKESKGQFRFNRNSKIYEADLTEWNLNWIHSFALQHNFEIDTSVTNLMSLLLAVEQSEHKIELQYNNNNFVISNAESSLNEYITNELGGFNLENIFTLCDYAPVLGYTIDKQIEQDVTDNLGPRFWSLCSNRNLKVDQLTSSNLVPEIAEYARLTDRFPIFVYEPDLSGRLHAEFNKFFPGNIVNLDNKLMDNVIDDSTRVIYTSKIPKKHFPRIPLMISSAGMLYGGDKQMWLQAAEKVVYFTNDVYNKTTKGKDVCKLD